MSNNNQLVDVDENYQLIERNLLNHSGLIKMKRYNDAFDLLSITIPAVIQIVGEYNPFLTILRAKLLLCKLMAIKFGGNHANCDRDELITLKRQLREAIRVTHGFNHDLYRQYRPLIEENAILV